MSLGRSSLVGAGSVAAPVGLFLLLKVTIGLGPASSPAGSVGSDASPGPLAAASAAITPEQRRAMDWLKSFELSADLPSPLDHPAAAVRPLPVEPEAEDPLAGLRLTAVLATGGDAWASIGGKVYRVGDHIAAGYTLRSIDASAQRVELVGPDGVSAWLQRAK
jgi:hypothetical protein